MRAPHDPELAVPLDSARIREPGAGPLNVLLVEDDRGDALLVEELIAEAAVDIRLVWVQTMAAAERELAARRPDCVLLDMHLPDATDVDAVYLDWGKPEQRKLGTVTPAELRSYNFPAGSMGPKVDAAVQFVERTGKRAAIGSLAEIGEIVAGTAGTNVVAG